MLESSNKQIIEKVGHESDCGITTMCSVHQKTGIYCRHLGVVAYPNQCVLSTILRLWKRPDLEARPGGPTWRWIAEQLLQLTTRMYSVQFSLSGETEPEADHQTHACSGFSL